ncbi:MAG: aldo/keto reductase [Candidatus Dormibacteraeota bacterium]|nr:aldo/keto reductase [Candidatus Dormibacteraeota bacterium]
MNPAATARLGRTGLQITALSFGTAPIGNLFEAVTDDEALAALEVAWNSGIRFFDTAPLYGHGLSEARVGRFLRGIPRDSYVLATKVGRLLRADALPEPGQSFVDTPPVNPVFDFSYDATLRSVEESLQRLGVDRVDVLHIHDPDDHYEEALNGSYRALDRLRSEGVIGAVGAGMNQWQMLSRFAREADFDCFLLAGRYTLLDQSAFAELMPLAAERGIAVIAGGVFNSGVLADPKPSSRFNYRQAPPELIEKAKRIAAVCARHGVPLKTAAVQFPIAHAAVPTVLIGSRSAAQVEENVRGFATPIPPQLWEELKAEGLLPRVVPTP